MSKETTIIPTTDEYNIYHAMAKTAGQSKLFDKLGGEAGILAIMLMARELGLPPFQAVMGGMNVIQGKVELSPRLMNSMIRKAGHAIDIVESTDIGCKIKGRRHDTKEEYTCSFTIDDARRAGLVRGGGGWEKFASDMLFARCLSRLARRLFADVISTAYIEGEISGHDYERVEPYIKPTIEDKVEAADVLMDKVEEMAPEMSLIEFTTTLNEKTGMGIDTGSMKAYLEHLEVQKNVSQAKIMQQALNAALLKRFCRSWKTWSEAPVAEVPMDTSSL